jgi:hypothetical protein
MSLKGSGLEIMSEIIAYCGLDCAGCDAFIATQAKDLERKKEMAKRWTKGLDVEFRPEDIDCTGCMSDKISGWCTKVCKIRPCAEARKVKTCAHCEDYRCEKLEEFLSNEPKAARTLEGIRRTLAA